MNEYRIIDDIKSYIKELLSEYEDDFSNESDYRKGYNECLNIVIEDLQDIVEKYED